MELIILIGSSRSGKTTYAHKVEKDKGYEYIGIDQNYHYGGNQEYFKFLDFLIEKLNNNQDKNFVLDGYIHFDKHFNYLRERLKHHKIKSVFMFANYKTIAGRGKGDPFLVNREEVINFHRNLPNAWDFEEFVVGDGENKKVKNHKEAMKIVEGITKQDVVNFLERLKTKNYDKYYQTVELPFGMKIDGYNANYEHKSWEKISDIYNLKDKKVADIGCFNGYFCFEAKNSGVEVVGYDKCIPAIETAKEIANLKELDIDFKVLDIEKEEIPEKYDLILFLNTSHHLKNVEIAFNDIFKKSKAVIVEMQFSNISREKVFKIAEKYGHKLTKEVDSARPNRTIMLFEK